MDVPLGVIERLDEGLERSPAGEPGMRSEELKAAGLMRCLQQRQHLSRNSRDSTGTGSR